MQEAGGMTRFCTKVDSWFSRVVCSLTIDFWAKPKLFTDSGSFDSAVVKNSNVLQSSAMDVFVAFVKRPIVLT